MMQDEALTYCNDGLQNDEITIKELEENSQADL